MQVKRDDIDDNEVKINAIEHEINAIKYVLN